VDDKGSLESQRKSMKLIGTGSILLLATTLHGHGFENVANLRGGFLQAQLYQYRGMA
jgi:hypothetical protein